MILRWYVVVPEIDRGGNHGGFVGSCKHAAKSDLFTYFMRRAVEMTRVVHGVAPLRGDDARGVQMGLDGAGGRGGREAAVVD